MKTTEELRKLDLKGLETELKTAQHELFKNKFEIHNAESKNIHQIGNYRKQIARIKTIKKEKELLEANSSENKEKELEKAV